MENTSTIEPTISSPRTADQYREDLKAVIDPEIFQNIVDLGLVYGVDVDTANAVTVNMTLTTPHCPMGPQIIEDVQNTLKKAGARDVDVNIVWEPQWTPYAMTEELQRELCILEDEPVYVPEPEPELPPEPPPKKRGLLGRIFGFD